MTDQASVFAYCEGVAPLRPRLEDWIKALLSDPERLHGLVEAHGAPLNIQCDTPFRRKITALNDCVAEYDLPFLPMFARKANKCLTYVNTAHEMGIGIDTASHVEVEQCLAQGMPGERIVCTAAVKDRALMVLCVTNGVTIILDNLDEVALLERVAQEIKTPVSVGLRMNGFSCEGQALYSRFGFPLREISSVAARLAQSTHIRLDGLHFHLNGYSAEDRIAAISQSLPVIAQVKPTDQRDFFLDIGGGIPMNYLDDPKQWVGWLGELDAALSGDRAPITQHNDPLGRKLGRDGTIDSYPVAQSLVQTDWMRTVLSARQDGKAIADQLRAAQVTLRCEPGRSLLDGCGITVARIAFCKTDSVGTPVVGVQMNRTQSRSGFAEFAIDPLMVPGPEPRGDAIEAYLAGTYCTESEWLTRRKMTFPQGARPGDLMVFPNTAGYLMHFLESRSHQFPLAKNVFVTPDPNALARVDAIDNT
ncbi:Y4yA family PLP-dependent enzyme [Sedimentitalea todarodis]|uniref:Y4yA family PLP-dependent enzyme n=1 Tax=Sedimentitalea todarodis TaxID=1631240 RepID=A0ABU3VKT0_9RHOB|nr:Y4yA family PLP-dependent enzyme [Sedimentitalea todarodis]MDU9006785.1 Y4yA family PLP-dependent enzyme [Sedimentitalea todarodis]